jgi:hypothetical protein
VIVAVTTAPRAGGMSVSQNKVLLKEIRPSCHHVIENIT